MGLGDLTSRAAVEQAVVECDDLGGEAFLEKHGFGRSKGYLLRLDGKDYDSKAIAAVAHGYQHPGLGPLLASEFSGGEQTVAKKLESLGFEVVRPAGRNPAWAFDELVLALDLYVRRGLVEPSDPDVVELSELLNSLPIHTTRPDAEKFRNTNGVSLKLANFAALDPGYPGTGMSAGGKRDAELWDRFKDDPDELHRLAEEIRSGANEGFPLIPEEGEEAVEEGRLLYRRHRTRERDRNLVKRKKQTVLGQTGRLACEACGFDFATTYGKLGNGFIECHHTVPLSVSGHTRTKLQDLVLLCSNCHRMAHQSQPFATVDELRGLIAAPSH